MTPAEIASQLGRPAETVIRTNSVANGVSLRFRPRYSVLGMRRTTAIMGLELLNTSALVSHFIFST